MASYAMPGIVPGRRAGVPGAPFSGVIGGERPGANNSGNFDQIVKLPSGMMVGVRNGVQFALNNYGGTTGASGTTGATGTAPTQPGTGGYYPFPYNQTGTATQAAATPWQPIELQRPATPYPGQQTPGQGKYYKRPSFGGRMGGYPLPPSHKPLDSFNKGETGLYASQMNVYNAGQAQLPPYMQRGGYSYGGSGGSAGGFQGAYDEARAENEARYRDILGGYEARRAAAQGAGAQESRDIDKAMRGRGAASRQSLVSRGLNNSTLLDTMQMGVERERADAQGRLNERLRREEADLLGDELRFMQERDDTYPDMGLLAQLAQGVGAAGGGGGAYMAAPPQYASPQSLGYQIPFGMNYAGPIGGGVRGGGVRGGGYGSVARKLRIGPDSAMSAAAKADRLRRMDAARAIYSGIGTRFGVPRTDEELIARGY